MLLVHPFPMFLVPITVCVHLCSVYLSRDEMSCNSARKCEKLRNAHTRYHRAKRTPFICRPPIPRNRTAPPSYCQNHHRFFASPFCMFILLMISLDLGSIRPSAPSW